MSRHSHNNVHGWHLHPQLADDTHPLAHWPVDVALLYFSLGGRSLAEHAEAVAAPLAAGSGTIGAGGSPSPATIVEAPATSSPLSVSIETASMPAVRICWISSSELSVNLERQNGWLIHEPDSSTTCMPIRNCSTGIFLINPRAFPVSPSRAPTSHKVCDFICRAFCLDKCHSIRPNGRLWRVKLRVRGP